MALSRAMPLSALKVFEVAARHSTFQHAARELFVTPAAVSHQIKRLEAYLHKPLFYRNNRSLQLTDAGAVLAGRLALIFSALNAALEESATGCATTVRVTAMPSFAAKWLVPRIGRFGEKNPAFSVEVHADDKLVDFPSEPFDIALRYGAGNYPGLHVELLMRAPATPVCSPAYVAKHLAAADGAIGLGGATLLHDRTSRMDEGIPDWRRWLAAAGMPQINGTAGPMFSEHHLALEAAIGGHGVALGLRSLVDGDLLAGRLVEPFDTVLENAYAFWIVCRPEVAELNCIQRFRTWLQDEAMHANAIQKA
jgi:LysR family glycine cleavage system transcriptional activator